ncbi:MAG: winged helix-turn-helix transcriptional regulator [Bacteroides sp.]|nr:winged helix-turn-helix transcriptional regulator [Bacteroides sp.]
MKKTLGYIFVCVMWLLFFAMSFTVYQDTLVEMKCSLDAALEEVVLTDFQNRAMSSINHYGGKINRKIKSVSIVGKDGPEEIVFKDSIDEVMGMRLVLQYILSDVNPIHPDTLNVMLQKQLSEKYDIGGYTGVIYIHNNKKYYGGSDLLEAARSSILTTNIKVLDAKSTISVQAWMDAHWITVMNNISFVTYLIQLLFFIASIFLTKLLLKRQDSSRYIRLNGMLLDTELCKVFIGNRECILRNAEFRLLMLFVNKRDHSLSRQEIHTQLWPEIDNPDNRINNLISTLRKALKDFPGCSLDMGEDKIYRLRILG